MKARLAKGVVLPGDLLHLLLAEGDEAGVGDVEARERLDGEYGAGEAAVGERVVDRLGRHGVEAATVGIGAGGDRHHEVAGEAHRDGGLLAESVYRNQSWFI